MENTLHVHATAIRKALGPNRHLLKTEQGRGYRLLGEWIAPSHDTTVPAICPRRMRADDESSATNLPESVTCLIGRTATVARLRDLVSAWRMVTLTGPGGIGKSSLALKVARALLGEFANGAWLVELASLSDPTLVPAAAARCLLVPTGLDCTTPEAIARCIGDKTLLLVLDDCEHLIGAAATLSETLLAHCPNITIIATSREILRIQGEQVYRVPALDVPASGREDVDEILKHSAVELFIARMKALDTGFSPGAHDLPIIGAICRHLDGIPLAIEFAAAHASMFGLKPMAAGLHDRFALLTHGRRTALPRHRTLRAVLDWSYETLPQAERHLLRHLAVFSGGFAIEAAAAVVNDGFTNTTFVADGIASLVAKSLIVLDKDVASRWYLSETVRAYALEKLVEHGERDGAALRHAAYFLGPFRRPVPVSDSGVSLPRRCGRQGIADQGRVALNL